jgi:molecular chaperone Hsp33
MKIKRIKGRSLSDQLNAKKNDRLFSFLLADGTVRGVIINGTIMLNEMRANHNLGIIETMVLGHAYIACGLMSAQLKGTDRITLQIDCSGPVKGLIVESNAFNEVRGYLKTEDIPVDKPLDNFNLSGFFGAGFLTVTKYLEDHKQPFSGKVMLEYGNIAEDIVNYYYISEQIPTALNLSIQFDDAGEVSGAGGLFLQAMPDADTEDISRIEEMVKALPSIGALLFKGVSPQEIIKDFFSEYSPEFLAESSVTFFCHCKKSRMLDYLSALPAEDISDIIASGDFPIEIRCHNCNTHYYIEETEFRKILTKKIN